MNDRQSPNRKPNNSELLRMKNRVIITEFVIIIILIVALICVSVALAGKPEVKDNSSLTSTNESESSSNISNSSQISSTDNGSSSNSDDSSNSGVSSLPSSNAATSSSNGGNSVANVGGLGSWNLKLVGPNNSLEDKWFDTVNGNLSVINSKFRVDKESSKYFDSRAISYLNNMCQEALDDGIKLLVVSSYRTDDYQKALYNNRVQRCINEGYSTEEAKKVAATIVALPGTSEHHLGLAVDFNSVEQSFENTEQFKWLKNNAADYGFVLRYSKDKQDITKIIYEPWHYRYVGVEHAKAMNSLGMCLEEYLEYLK